MILTQAEVNKNRMISAGITLTIFALLLLFLILFQLVTPNPPFPLNGGGGGQEMAIGMMNVGNDDVDFSDMGKVTDVVTENTPVKEEIITDENGEAVPMEKKETEKKPEVKEEPLVIKPVKEKPVVKEMTLAEKIAAKAKKNKGKTGGGKGDNEEAGESGMPGGDPFGKGDGGTGGGTGGGNGTGKGDGNGPGGPHFTGGGIAVNLTGRALIKPPKLPSDTKEEGKVVVDIVVDTQGNVIEASPNGRGTTTSSALLKAKARQAAMNTKFDVNGKFEEQRGTITIIFSFD